MNSLMVFLVATVCLVGIHCASVFVGSLATYILSPLLLTIITIVVFFLFGMALIYQGYTEEDDENFDSEY